MTATTQAPRRYVRHWKERFNKDAPLIFLRPMKLGLVSTPRVMPGDPVTDELRKELGAHRLKLWWNARVVGTKEYAIALMKPAPEPVPAPKAKPTVISQAKEPLKHPKR